MATALSALRIDAFRTSGVRTNGRPGLSQMDLFAGLPERDLALLDSRLQLVRWPRGAARYGRRRPSWTPRRTVLSGA